MALLAMGLNHKTASIDIREKFAFPSHVLGDVLQQLSHDTQIQEIALLSTCNRTEIYCAENKNHEIFKWLQHQCKDTTSLPPELFYEFKGQAAVSHVMRVACGLDSMVIGENQILGQMKTAFHVAQQVGSLGSHLNRLFQTAFRVAKDVRANTPIGASPLSLGYAAIKLASRLFEDLSQASALLIGAGETIDLAAFHLKQHHLQRVLFANRTEHKAQEMAAQYGGQAMTFAQLSEYIATVDIIFTATGSTLPILGKGLLERALRQRKQKPIFVVDLAVPRDVEPEVKQLEDVYLYTIDDLQNIVDDNLQIRMKAAELAETIIDQKAMHFMQWVNGQASAQTVARFRSQADAYKQSELEKAKMAIDGGEDVNKVLERFAHSLTNKLIHEPTIWLKENNQANKIESFSKVDDPNDPNRQ